VHYYFPFQLVKSKRFFQILCASFCRVPFHSPLLGGRGIILPLDSLAAGPSVQCQQSTSPSARFLPILLSPNAASIPLRISFLPTSTSSVSLSQSPLSSHKQVAHLLTLICLATAKYDLFCLRLNRTESTV
jgi:hypothetical protein